MIRFADFQTSFPSTPVLDTSRLNSIGPRIPEMYAARIAAIVSGRVVEVIDADILEVGGILIDHRVGKNTRVSVYEFGPGDFRLTVVHTDMPNRGPRQMYETTRDDAMRRADDLIASYK